MTAHTALDTRRLAAFVARVDALRPEDWGRLDAAGARLLASDPFGFAERSVRFGALVGGVTGAGDLLALPAVVALQGAGWLLNNLTDGARIVLDLPPREKPSVEEVLRRILARPPVSGRSEDGGPLGDAVRHVAAATLDAAGTDSGIARAEPALAVLGSALAAVAWSERLGAGNAARLYAPVEPVIPWASLDEGNGPLRALPRTT